MLPKYSKMFTITFLVCSFSIAYSQSPVVSNLPYSSSFQSVSYSGPGSSSVVSSGTSTSYSGAGTSYVSNSGLTSSSSGSLPAFTPVSNSQLQSTFPPITDPNIEVFAHSLTQVLLNSPVLNAVGDFVITHPYELIFEVGRAILERDNVLDPSLAEFAARGGSDVGSISKYLYFNTITHMFGKLLFLNNRLNQESTATYPNIILSYVEDYGIKNGVFDIESVLKTVTGGILDFGTSIGINNSPNLTIAFQLFVQELKSLASGTNI